MTFITIKKLLLIVMLCVLSSVFFMIPISASNNDANKSPEKSLSEVPQYVSYFTIADELGTKVTFTTAMITVEIPYKKITYNQKDQIVTVLEACFSPTGSGSKETIYTPSDEGYKSVRDSMKNYVTTLAEKIDGTSQSQGTIKIELPSYREYTIDLISRDITLTEATFSPHGSGIKKTIYSTENSEYSKVLNWLKEYPVFVLQSL